MKQYIDKSALVAEINRRIEEYRSLKIDSSYYDGKIASLESMRDEYINSMQEEPKCIYNRTLEVRGVDLEKEVNDWYNTKASKEFENVLYSDIENCAKYFFELGLKAQKGE